MIVILDVEYIDVPDEEYYEICHLPRHDQNVSLYMGEPIDIVAYTEAIRGIEYYRSDGEMVRIGYAK